MTNFPGVNVSDHLRELIQNQSFQPTQVGFACVAAISNRLVQDIREGHTVGAIHELPLP